MSDRRADDDKPAALPDLNTLVAAVKAAGEDPAARNAALDEWAPAVDELLNLTQAAGFLGIKPASFSRARQKIRADGTPYGPGPDRMFGRSGAWSYRTLVLNKAASPGLGGSGRFKPGESGRSKAKKPPEDQPPEGG